MLQVVKERKIDTPKQIVRYEMETLRCLKKKNIGEWCSVYTNLGYMHFQKNDGYKLKSKAKSMV